MSTLVDLARRQAGRIGLASVCMAVAAATTAGYAFLVGPVVRSLFLTGEETAARISPGAGVDLGELARSIGAASPLWIGAAIVAVSALKGIAFLGQSVLTGRAGQEVLLRLRASMYRGLLALNPLRRDARARGDLVARFTVDVEAVEQAVSRGLVGILRDGLQIIALAALALALDPVLGLVGLLAFPLVAAVIVRLGRRLRRRRAAVHAAFGEVGELVDETAAGLGVIRAFGAAGFMAGRFGVKSGQILERTMRTIRVRALSSPINELLGAAALAGTLWYARDRIASGALTPEAFVSFFTALFLLYQPVKGLGQANHAIQTGLAALQRIDSLLDAAVPHPERAALMEETAAVRLEGIEAGYGADESVLERVDLDLPAGSRTALIGASGAGKTTLLNVLLGLLEPRRGELLVNGRTLPGRAGGLAGYVAPVPQDPFLFDDTIRINVLCGRPAATEEMVEGACRVAGVLGFARGLRGGLDAQVGKGGAELSLGQRQRVCLARALLSPAPVLLLDEVTASLDGETEQALVERLDRYLGDRSVLVVTHRLATARWADRVVVLDGGSIRASGPVDELLDSDRRVVRLFGDQVGRRGKTDVA